MRGYKDKEQDIIELSKLVDSSIYLSSYRDALIPARQLADKYHLDYKLETILSNIAFSSQEWNDMVNPELYTASSLFLAGYCTMNGYSEQPRKPDIAYNYFKLSSTLGHIFSIRYMAYLTYYGASTNVKMDEDTAMNAGMDLYIEASVKGCRDASHNGGHRFKNEGNYKMASIMWARGAIQGHRGSLALLKKLRHQHTAECCPKGNEWMPTLEVQLRVPDYIHRSMVQAYIILILKFRVNKYVAYIIMQYICTPNNW